MKPVMIACAVLLVFCTAGTRVEAQEVASSFDQLRVLVKPGDTVSVVDVTGREDVGQIGAVLRDSMILVTRAGPRKLGEADVATIRQRRNDSLKNGAVIGTVAGTAYGLVGLALTFAMDDGGGVSPLSVATGLLFFGGIGAATGVGIDALIMRRHVIYREPNAASRVSVSPLFGHGRRGAAVSVKF